MFTELQHYVNSRKNKYIVYDVVWGVLTWFCSRQAHIGVKGQVRDADTGQPLPNTIIHAKNITAGRNDDILHDVTSGEFSRLNIRKQEN